MPGKTIEEKPICINCKHVLRSAEPLIWYNFRCKLAKRVPSIDCVSGKPGFVTQNSLGMGYISDDEYEYCRDNNQGTCQNYEAQKENAKTKEKGENDDRFIRRVIINR